MEVSLTTVSRLVLYQSFVVLRHGDDGLGTGRRPGSGQARRFQKNSWMLVNRYYMNIAMLGAFDGVFVFVCHTCNIAPRP